MLHPPPFAIVYRNPRHPSISMPCDDDSRPSKAISITSPLSSLSTAPSPMSATSLTLSALLSLLPQLAIERPTALEALRVIAEEELAQEDGDEAAPDAPEGRPTWGWHGHKHR